MNITQYWANFFGTNGHVFDQRGLQLHPHTALGDYWGIWLFARNDLVIVSAPDPFLPTCRRLFTTVNPDDLRKSETVSKLFGAFAERVIGPVYHGSLGLHNFVPVDCSNCREISAEEAQLINDGDDPIGWEWSGCGEQKQHYFGAYRNGRLSAVSNYSIENESIAFPGIYTHPTLRGRGFSKVALSYAFDHALNAGLLIRYQTLVSNAAAVRSAESLGVKKFATHIAVRLSQGAYDHCNR